MFSNTEGGTVMIKYRSPTALLIEEYIFYREASDHWNESSYAPTLLIFDRYCSKEYPNAQELSQEMVDTWCSKRDTEENNSCRSRIYPIISFLRYIKSRGKIDIVVPELPCKTSRTYIPHAFTGKELQEFFNACDTITGIRTPEQRARKVTVPVFFRLLYSSGIRTTEARSIRVEDVDLNDGVLNIRYSKGYGQHFIVLHDSMLEVMRKFDTVICQTHPNRTYFFPARKDKHHTRGWVQLNFRKLWDKKNTAYATAYELRHHYATANINRWIGEGMGFHSKFLYLSKSMGHSVLESTEYYYSLTPGLSDILKDKTNDSFNDIIPDIH